MKATRIVLYAFFERIVLKSHEGLLDEFVNEFSCASLARYYRLERYFPSSFRCDSRSLFFRTRKEETEKKNGKIDREMYQNLFTI